MMGVIVRLSSRCRICVFFFKQKTAYEMRISDWSSDVCSSDLRSIAAAALRATFGAFQNDEIVQPCAPHGVDGLRRCAGGLSGPGAEIGRASGRERVCQ